MMIPGIVASVPLGFGGTPAAPRTILRYTANDNGGSGGDSNLDVTLTWPTPVVDGLGAYSAGSPTRLTVPSGWTHVVLYACVSLSGIANATTAISVRIKKNGSNTWIGGAYNIRGSGADSSGYLTGAMCQTPIIPVSPGDYFEVAGVGSGNANILGTDDMPTLFMMYGVEDVSGALVNLTGNFSAVTATTVVSWQAEQYDEGGYWSSGTDVVIPSGVTRASATAQFVNEAADVTSSNNSQIATLLNGSIVQACRGYATSTSAKFNSYSGPVSVSAGNALTMRLICDAAYTINSSGTSFGVEGHARDCCVVSLTSNLTTIDADTSPPYVIGWTSEVFDDAGIFSAGSNTRLTSPGGWVQVGAFVSMTLIGIGDSINVTIAHFNSAGSVLGLYRKGNAVADTNGSTDCWTPHINTTAGDYFVCRVEVIGDTSVTIESISRFWMEVYEE